MFFRGIRFGMLLQVAIGPVSLFILATAINSTLFNSLLAVLAVMLVDAIYITLALFGVTSFLRSKRDVSAFKWLSAVILILFGANIILNTFGIRLSPGFALINTENSFIYAFILTAASPLTILFWAGVFGARVAGERYRDRDLYYFALGCLSSTPLFLVPLSFMGSYG